MSKLPRTSNWRLIFHTASFFLAFVGLVYFRSSHLSSTAFAQTTSTETSGGSCSIIGNNTASNTGNGDMNEAEYTMVLLLHDFSNRAQVANAIKSSSKTVIVRLGAGEGHGPVNDAAGQQYGQVLTALFQETGKPFIATAGHNEPNCAEYIPLAEEEAFYRGVRSATNGQITLITGQIDIICGDWQEKGRPSPTEYIQKLGALTSGVSLPFYTGDAGSSGDMLAKIDGAIGAAGGKDIYITESGPFKRGSAQASEEEFKDFVSGMSQVVGKAKAVLLFNAFGLNGDANFSYTKPFWKAKCREAFRTQCTDIEAVVEACFGGADEDEYYLYPIKGAISGNGSMMYQDLVAQGYEARCASPSITIKASDNLDERLKELAPEPLVTVDSEQKVDYSNAQIPLWRQAGVLALDDMKSIEGYYSYRNTTETDPVKKQMLSSAAYRLTNLKQQCRQQVDILETIEKKCAELKKPDSCALDIEIEKTGLKASDALALYRNKGLTCSEIINLPDDDKLKTTLANVPFYLPKAYRLAFLVISAELQGPERGLSPPPPFNFLRVTEPLQPGFDPKHEVRVIAFKVPDFGTNRDEASPSYYKDSLQIVRDALTPHKLVDEIKVKIRDFKSSTTPTSSDPNYTVTGLSEQISCQGSEACSKPAVKTLVDFVNLRLKDESQCALSPTDPAMKYEPASQIADSAGTPPTNGVDFATPENGNLLQRLKEQWISNKIPDGGVTTPSTPAEQGGDIAADAQTSSQGVKPFKFFSEYNVKLGEGDRETKMNVYLVYPQGYELAEVEKALAGAIYTEPLVKDFFADNDLTRYFKITDTGQEFPEAKGMGTPFEDDVCFQACMAGAAPPPPTAPGQIVTDEVAAFTSKEKACHQQCLIIPTVTITADPNTDHEPRILGGILGKLMREVQKAVRQFGSKEYGDLESCKTTEDFLMGRCGGNVDTNLLCQNKYKDLPEGDEKLRLIAQCNNNFTNTAEGCIGVWIDSGTAQQYAAELRANLPSQQKPSSSFAGWQAYFGIKSHPEYQYLWGECGGKTCYDYILDRVLSESSINPYLAIAISLNETGGLYSENPDKSGPHFGCAPWNPAPIEEKLTCMITTLNNYKTRDGLDDDAALRKYGYVGGMNNKNLNKIIEILSNFNYGGSCPDAQNTAGSSSETPLQNNNLLN